MNFNLRALSVIFAVVLCLSLLAACGGETVKQTDPATEATTTASAETEAFVIPADQMGKIIAADSTLITWNEYKVDDKTIDFMGVDTKALKDPSEEVSLFYLEEDVTYYLIKDGKLVEAIIEDVVPGSIVGITTLEEGVQELYILSVPADDTDIEDNVDHTEEIVDYTTAATTTSAAEEPKDEGSEDVVATEAAN